HLSDTTAVLPLIALLAVAAAPAPPLNGVELRTGAGGELQLVVTPRAKATWRSLSSGQWMGWCQAIGGPFGDEPGIGPQATGVVAPARLSYHTGIHPARLHLDFCSGSVQYGQDSHAIPSRTLTARGKAALDISPAVAPTLSVAEAA